jgi:hypothetical protein
MLRAEALAALWETEERPTKAEGAKAATEANPAKAIVNFIFERKNL